MTAEARAGTASDTAELDKRVNQVSSGGARAAVLGVSDGLVTNVSLILGLAGAGASASSVRDRKSTRLNSSHP